MRLLTPREVEEHHVNLRIPPQILTGVVFSVIDGTRQFESDTVGNIYYTINDKQEPMEICIPELRELESLEAKNGK